MQSHARVVIIGGGVVGCSVLYHLARFGWTDVLLLERAELTSGSTWHAAGGMHTINGDPNVAKLQAYTVNLYKEIEAESGQSTGLHMTGGIMLAATRDRFDWMKGIHAKGRYMGLDTELISPTEAHALFPLMDPTCFVGAMYDPVEGHLDPSGTTHAYAKAAKQRGGSIETHVRVTGLIPRPAGGWTVETTRGPVVAEHVVNAGGLWAREVGRMVGIELPVLAMEHMYLITEDMPEVAEINRTTGKEILHAVDFDGEIYLRQERGGMLMGTYEKDCRPWSPKVTPWDFGTELLPPDLDRIAPSLEVGFRHFPAFQTAGIKRIINGPFTFAPDGNPLVGPVKGLPGFWCACGVMAGFSQGGGVGLALANWMIQGDPGFDIWGMDVARFGDWAGLAYTNAKVRENYSRRFSIRYPNEELPAARPLKTSPIHDRQLGLGAQMGVSWGLEQPLWYAPPGVQDAFSWRRSTDFPHVAAEVAAVRGGVGIMETSGFAKYRVTGPGAEDWLARMLAGRMPKTGRMALAPMLKADGRLIGDFTLAKLGEGRFFLAGSGPAEDYHLRWFQSHLPETGVRVEALGGGLVGLAIAGPRSRDLLARVCDVPDLRFMDIRETHVGMAPVLLGRVSYTGDLGYEIWMGPEYQAQVFDLLMVEGTGFGLRPFGLRALNALRLEKGFGSWGREYRPIYGPVEAGLDRFIDLARGGFIGHAAAVEERATGGRMRLRVFTVEARDADVIGDEPIWQGDTVVGWITSGGFAHGAGVSVALGYVPKEMADLATGWRIELLGEMLAAKPQPHPLFDPEGQRMRG